MCHSARPGGVQRPSRTTCTWPCTRPRLSLQTCSARGCRRMATRSTPTCGSSGRTACVPTKQTHPRGRRAQSPGDQPKRSTCRPRVLRQQGPGRRSCFCGSAGIFGPVPFPLPLPLASPPPTSIHHSLTHSLFPTSSVYSIFGLLPQSKLSPSAFCRAMRFAHPHAESQMGRTNLVD